MRASTLATKKESNKKIRDAVAAWSRTEGVDVAPRPLQPEHCLLRVVRHGPTDERDAYRQQVLPGEILVQILEHGFR